MPSPRNLPMDMTMRRLLTASMALTLLVSAACGGSLVGRCVQRPDHREVTAEPELISSGTATRAAGSARVEMLVTLSSGATTVMTMKGAGVVGFEPSAASMSLRICGDKSLGLVDGMAMQELLVDDATYIKSPLFAGISGSGKPQWVKVDLGALGADAGPAGVGSSQSDPSLMLDYLRGVTSSISRGGHRRHPRRADDPLPRRDEHAEGLREASRRPAQAPAGRTRRDAGAMPIDVWVDDDGRVRRIEVSIDIVASGQTVSSPPGSTTTTSA